MHLRCRYVRLCLLQRRTAFLLGGTHRRSDRPSRYLRNGRLHAIRNEAVFFVDDMENLLRAESVDEVVRSFGCSVVSTFNRLCASLAEFMIPISLHP